jgi:hypothetical protein
MFIKQIYLSWRPGKGKRRHIVGILKRNSSEGVKFSYILPEVKKAKEEGFVTYAEFPDINKVYTEHVMEILSQRLIKHSRPDRIKMLQFWEADNSKYDDFDILALTQGWLPTDNFEFLGVFNPIKDFCFVTDLTGLSSLNLSRNFVKPGDNLKYEFERTNEFDKEAVMIKNNNGQLIGYIKKIHCKFFHQVKSKYTPKITVKTIDQNGIIKQIFLKVEI